jgi:hypothetical protein
MKEMKLNIQLFGHTNSTENYELPQFVGTDKPTWLGDINTAMSTIDTAMGTNSSNISSLGTRVTNAEGVATQASTDVATLTGTVNTLSGNVTTVTTTANNAQSTATSALNTANSASDKANANAGKIGDLTDLTTTANTDLVSATNEVNEKTDKHLICADLSANQSVSVGTAYNQYQLNLNETRAVIGTKLTFDTTNHRILVGSGVNHVKISAYDSVKGIANAIELCVRKNGTIIGMDSTTPHNNNSIETVAVVDLVTPVVAGDYIDVAIRAGATGTLTVAGTTYSNICVEVID